MTRHEFPSFAGSHHSALWRFGTGVLAVGLTAGLTALSAPAASVLTAAATVPAAATSAVAMATGCPTPAASAVYRSSPTYAKTVALTIDDGPSSTWTPQVLDILKANHIGATFFVIGENVRDNPALIRRTIA